MCGSFIHKELGYDTLDVRRRKLTTVKMHKVDQHMMLELVTKLFTRLEEKHERVTRSVSNKKMYVPRKRLEYGKHCFTYRESKIWQEIPLTYKNLMSIEDLKHEIEKWTWSDLSIP